MLNKDQNQALGAGAAAFQAGGDLVVNIGVSYEEACRIAHAVSREHLQEYSIEARELASRRVDEITDAVIKKIQQENPEGLQKAKDPDFQASLMTVQREFARTGDPNLGDLLVNLLVDRSKQEVRDINQIVLNESLAVAPKLTDAHLSALAVIFIFKHTQNRQLDNHEMLGEFLDSNVLPFLPTLSRSEAGYQHMEYTGVGSISVSIIGLASIFAENYQGLFVKGFEKAEIESRGISVGFDPRFFVPCLNDPTKIQAKGISKNLWEAYLDSAGVSPEDREKLLELYQVNQMDQSEIKHKLIALRPYMAELFEVWSNSLMQNFTLTTVGIAIGHANVKRATGKNFGGLEIWLT